MKKNISKTIKSYINYISSRLVPVFMGVISIYIYTRLLTPSEYGMLNLALTTVSFISTLFLTWLNKSSLRYYNRFKDNNSLKEFISTNVILISFLSFSLVLFFFLITSFFNLHEKYELIDIMRIGIFLVGIQGLFEFIITISRAQKNSLKYSLFVSLNSLIKVLFVYLTLKLTNYKVKGILFSIFVSYFLFVIYELFKNIFNKRIKLYFSKEIIKKVMDYGIPLIGISIAGLVLSMSDRYMIKFFLNDESVGIYSAGYKVAQMSIQNIFMILMLVAFPDIIEKYEQHNEKVASKTIIQYINIYFLILIPSLFGIWALSQNILLVLVGENYLEAYKFLPWISMGIFVLGLTQYINKSFQLKEKTSILFYLILISSIINVILNLYFIPNYGIKGAAYTTLISYIFHLFISYIISRSFFEFKFKYETFLKSILSSISMFIILRKLTSYIEPMNVFSLIIKIIVGFIVYVILLTILKEKNTLYFYRNMKNKIWN